MPHILLLDNYDSFTYNLVHYLEMLGAEVTVVRNDELFDTSDVDGIVFSPGPGLPENAGRLLEVIELNAGKKPMLGVCLGMQAIAQFLGGSLYNQKVVKHGVEESVELSNSLLFEGITSPIKVGLYHSWSVSPHESAYTTVAKTDTDVVMAIENVEKQLYGVQFHPESIMTSQGQDILANFLKIVKA